MYDLPELAWAHDAVCAALLVRLQGSRNFDPDSLPAMRDNPAELPMAWGHARLLLSQTCGYPLVTSLAGRVRLVATPCYAAEGCSGAWMRSALLVRDKEPAETLAELRGSAICAINGRDSNSGMNLLRAAVAPLAGGKAFFRDVLLTGAHAASMAAVQDQRADVAAIDCVTLALLRRVRPSLAAGLRVLAWTQATPGLPLVTSAGMPDAGVAALRAALAAVLADPGLLPARTALLIEGFEVLDEAVYERVAEIEQEALALSYPVLR